MNETDIIEIGRDAMWVILKISFPIMMAGLIIGLIIDLFQALTTIQEMTLTFVPKVIFIFGAIILLLPFMLSSLTEFTQALFDRMASLG